MLRTFTHGALASALLTDLYELTMAFAAWESHTADYEAAFHLTFRETPFGGGYAVACGLGPAIDYLLNLRFTGADLDYLRTLRGQDGCPLFADRFLDFLKDMVWKCDVDAVAEGTVVFPQEPLVRVCGPLLQAQIVETALLKCFNFQTLIATKAARICQAAGGDPVIEFGLRRAQGPDGGFSAAREVYIVGCAGTSNVLAGKLFGIPVAGTHSHSWVLAFDSELEAFRAYAQTMPANATFLVDAFDTMEGVNHAIMVGRELATRGHRMAGIRLDSGNLASQARKRLDEAGFRDTAVVASNDLDEEIITSLKRQGARINIWGVGTRLVTGYGDPALGGVYKLTAIRKPGGEWQPKLKLSEQALKMSNPGLLQVRRFRTGSWFSGDAIYDVLQPTPECFEIVDPIDPTRRKELGPAGGGQDLLIPVFRRGKLVYDLPRMEDLRQHVGEQLLLLHPGIRRRIHPHAYPVGLEQGLYERKTRQILKARARCSSGNSSRSGGFEH